VLAFGALVDLSLAPRAPDSANLLAQPLTGIRGAVVTLHDGEMCVAQASDARTQPYDEELPYRDADVVVAGAIRLDTRARLRAELSPDAPGALADASDARLVAMAFRRWHERFAEHLLGDYAVVVWHRASERLIAARDPLGNRQLFWARSGSLVAVGSSVDIVRALPGLSDAVDDASIASILREGWIERAEGTVLRHVHRVPAAHTLCLARDSAPSLRRHWDFPEPSPLRFAREEEYADRFGALLDEVVADRLRGGAATVLLSGGMDSSSLAAAARRAAPAAALRALTVVSPTLAPSDDDRLSDEIARWLGVERDVCNLERVRSLDHLQDSASLPGQPLDEPDLASLRLQSAAAARHAPLALFGEDGDMLLHAPTLLGQLRTQRPLEVAQAWLSYRRRVGRWPWVGLGWRQRLQALRGSGAPNRAWWVRGTDYERRTRGVHRLRPQTVRALTSPQWDALFEALEPCTTRAAVLYTFPLTDPRLLEFVFAIPPVPWCQEKTLLRRAMRDALPPAVLARPKTPLSGFFEARVAQWREAGLADTPISPRVAPWVDVDAVRAVLRDGAPYDVLDAWRVLQVDAWLSREESRRA
jgi:asparagine synthase (glutamine-hydrolysing)